MSDEEKPLESLTKDEKKQLESRRKVLKKLLIAGGAGAALVKSGLLARLWKLVVGGLAALAAGLGKFGKRLFGGSGAGGLQQQRTV